MPEKKVKISKKENPGTCNCCKTPVRSLAEALQHLQLCDKLSTVFTPGASTNTERASEKGYYFQISYNLQPKVYWMIVGFPESFSLCQIDIFLRSVWFDGGGSHESSFCRPLNKVLTTVKDLLPEFQENRHLLEYVYDDNRSAKLTLNFLCEIPSEMKVPADHALVLIRNSLPEMKCTSCRGEKGKYFCRFCFEPFGENCVHRHRACDEAEDDELFEPVLTANSPACILEDNLTRDDQIDYPVARVGSLIEAHREITKFRGNEKRSVEDEADDTKNEEKDRFIAKKLRK
jgi:hypothetical protein